MTEANANSPKSAKTRRLRWRHAAYVAAVIVIVAACCVAGLFWYASTPQFAEKVHRAVVLGLEKSTGGRVEIGSFRWNARHLTAEVDNLTIHGTEAPGEAPYLHVDHLALQARILTFFTPSWIPRIALASLIAEGPTLHLIVYPDGSTNQPKPQTPSKHSLQQRLLGLEIGHTRVENGLILLNNRRIPWEMAAGSLSVEMRYVAADRGYEATLDAKDITFRLKKAMEAHSQLRARISLEHNAIRVQELDLKTGDSQLQAKGELHDFANPNWMASIHGSIDARQVGAITGETELRGGTAAVSLRARGTSNASRPEAFQIAGHVDMRGADWEAPWLRLQKVELHTDLTIDNDQCSFTNFSSVLEDQGRVDGSLILKHCIGPSAPVIVPPNDRTRSAAVTHSRLRAWMERHPGLSPREFLKRLRGEHRRVALQKRLQNAEYRPLEANLQAQVSGITLPLILAATAPKPYWNIGFTTATFGKVTAHWTGDGNGLDVHGVLTMRAPRNLNGLIPVTGSATADYLGDHRHLAITDADEHTPGTQVHAAGLLTLLTNDPKTDLRMDVTGNNLGEFDRLLTILDLKETPAGEPHALPLRLLGNATFHGDIHGSYFALAATGRLDAGKFQMVVERSAKEGEKITGASPPRFLTWDAFHSDVSYTPSHLIVRDAELVRGHTDIHVGLNMVPERTAPGEYTYDRRSQIAASVQTTGASVADLQSIAGISYPATGTLAADAHVTGTAGDWTGAGQALLTNAWIRGQKISVASIHLSILGHVVHAPHIRLTAAGGHASGQLTYDYESGALTGELTGRDFALAEIAALQTPRAAVGGRAGFHLQASGQASSPNATLVLQTEDVTLNQQPMGEVRVAAHLQNGTMYVTSSAKFRKARMDAAGQVRFSGDDPAKLEMTFAGLDIDPLLRMLAPNGVGGHSALDGHITVSGPLKEPAAMEGSADVETFAASVDRLPIHADGPIRLSLHKGKLQLDQVRFQGKSMSLSASGTVDLLDGYRLRLHSEGAIDASLASAFNRNIQSSGQIRFVVNAYGTAKRPDLRGRAEVSHVNVHLADVTNGLTDMNGELAFDQDRLAIQRLQGSSGGGALALTGFIGYRNGIFVDVTATANEVRIRYPKGVSTAVDAKLRLLGTSDSLLLSGNVKAMRFGIGSNVDLTSFMTGASGVSGPIDPTSPLNRVRLDIHVTSAPELAFQNSFASLAGDVNLRIRGTLENSSILGRIDISEGSASFAGTRYRLQQGDITFNNPITISPEINLEATARVQNYDIIVSLHGPPSKLNISYRSEPPLTQADVLALLALGRTNEQATMYGEQQQANANLTTEALLGGALNAAVSSRVQKLFGVGSVRVDPNFVGTLGESTARVTVEQQVGRNVTLTFATNVNTTAQQLIQAQFDLTRNLSIIAVRDEADVFSAYLQIRGRHK